MATSVMRIRALVFGFAFFLPGFSALGRESVWAANDSTRVERSGAWAWTSHRYAATHALATVEDGAALELGYNGRGLILGLDTLTPPNNYGPPELGLLEIFVDGVRTRTVRPRAEDREVVLLRSPGDEEHRVRLVHRRDGAGVGCRITGFRVLAAPSGDLAFIVSGGHNGAMIDLRATLTQGGQVVREALLRNWLTGQCRLAGLPPGDGYVLELRAMGWKTWRQEGISIRAGDETALPSVFLPREWDVPADSFKFPALGRPVVCGPQGTFRARFEAHNDEIRGTRLVRQQGPATISRACVFTEDKAAAYYYHREGVVTLPAGLPAGLYDLEVALANQRGPRTMVSRRCVVVVDRFPRDPVFMTFGHLDTWGQYQAEYLARLVVAANLLAPDMVLVSNEANPAYVAGALYGLEIPFVVNFGNHRGPEAGPWFGEPVGIVDFGPELSVLNFGRPWDAGTAEADHFLSARAGVPCKVINAFEPNAPVHEFLDRHRIALIHEAHGPGTVVAKIGATPTIRAGKSNSESFRIIRFKDHRPISYTYRSHAVAPIPFKREAPPPVRVVYEPENDGTHAEVTARIENDLEEAFPDARLVFVLPRGDYQIEGGKRERAIVSDDRRFTVLSVRLDLPANGRRTVKVHP
ncbi:MAG: hypothetical protein HY736_06965 [Verrucomicrobia bacterium]|nr:hypothetical protein [Verrucomicrobiota bacterium]